MQAGKKNNIGGILTPRGLEAKVPPKMLVGRRDCLYKMLTISRGRQGCLHYMFTTLPAYQHFM